MNESFHLLDSIFGMSIWLGVRRGWCFMIDHEFLTEFLKLLQLKLRTTVSDNHFRNATVGKDHHEWLHHIPWQCFLPQVSHQWPSTVLICNDDPLFSTVISKISVNLLKWVNSWFMWLNLIWRVCWRRFNTRFKGSLLLLQIQIDKWPPDRFPGSFNELFWAWVKIL